jgi:hypothetical protein
VRRIERFVPIANYKFGPGVLNERMDTKSIFPRSGWIENRKLQGNTETVFDTMKLPVYRLSDPILNSTEYIILFYVWKSFYLVLQCDSILFNSMHR